MRVLGLKKQINPVLTRTEHTHTESAMAFATEAEKASSRVGSVGAVASETC